MHNIRNIEPNIFVSFTPDQANKDSRWKKTTGRHICDAFRYNTLCLIILLECTFQIENRIF